MDLPPCHKLFAGNLFLCLLFNRFNLIYLIFTSEAIFCLCKQGHLLVIENFKSFKLNHGIMEAGYTKHQSATLKATASDSGPVYNAQDLSVSMTATMDASGNLVLGKQYPVVEL